MSTTQLELDDIQGNIVAGFNTNFEVLVGLTADYGRFPHVALWLAGLGPQLTSVAEVHEQRNAMKAPLQGGAVSLSWLCAAIGGNLLSAIRRDLFIRDIALTAGFQRRAKSALGDESDPDGWVAGGPGKALDVLLIIASNVEQDAVDRADELIAGAAAAGLICTYRETARRIADLEHFGFRDGVSQPQIRGYDPAGTLGPGEFVFGYERKPGDGGYSPAVDPNDLLRNGSLLVFRRLAQDVEAFHSFCSRKAAVLAPDFPNLSGAQLAALLVGRWPSGALAAVDVPRDPGKPPHDNDFDFSGDHMGTSCPFGAHIRKVNPRAGPKDVVDIPRLIRRGIPFGPPYDSVPKAERGLAFISFQTSIRNQLEFLTGSWMNSPARPGPNAGHDLLVGRTAGPRKMTIAGPSGRVEVSDDGAQWVTPTGGGYFFVPGKSAMSRMADRLAPGLGWRAAKLAGRATSAFRNSIEIFAALRQP